MAIAVNAGVDEYVTWDREATISKTATVTGAAGPFTTSYAWSFTSKPTGSTATLTNATSATVSFQADKPGEYVLSVTATDSGTSATDSAKMTVRPTHWVKTSGAKRPATMRAKVTPPSVVTSTVEANV
jgi:hypothetical protein